MSEIKHHIDPYNTEPQDTICATIRKIWIAADNVGNREIRELAAVAFDQGKRMSISLRKHRKRYMALPQDMQQKMDQVGLTQEEMDEI